MRSLPRLVQRLLQHQAALDKKDNGSALCQALETFREQFAELSRKETVFNPYHLLDAFEMI